MTAGFSRRERALQKLAALPVEVRKQVSVASEAGAKLLVEKQKSFVPVDDGTLRDSIQYRKGSFEVENSGILGRSKGVNAVIGDPDLTFTVTAGSKEAYYARFVEFGTKSHPQGGKFKGTTHPGTHPQPFFFPAWRLLKRKIKTSISKAARKAAKDVAKT